MVHVGEGQVADDAHVLSLKLGHILFLDLPDLDDRIVIATPSGATVLVLLVQDGLLQREENVVGMDVVQLGLLPLVVELALDLLLGIGALLEVLDGVVTFHAVEKLDDPVLARLHGGLSLPLDGREELEAVLASGHAALILQQEILVVGLRVLH